MTLYVIRHKATGKLMPQMKRGRGYTHWNPGVPTLHYQQVFAAMDIPRFFSNEKTAKACVVQWAYLPNARMKFGMSYQSEENVYLDTRQDGRTKDDLEVVLVEVVGL